MNVGQDLTQMFSIKTLKFKVSESSGLKDKRENIQYTFQYLSK